MTAPDMVSIIAEVLVTHYSDSVMPADLDADNPQWIVSCDCDWTGTAEALHAAHQARAVLAAISEAHMLRAEPWPPIPYPENAKHQARCTIQRAHDAAWFRTGDHNEGHMAAADALLAEGWTSRQTVAVAEC